MFPNEAAQIWAMLMEVSPLLALFGVFVVGLVVVAMCLAAMMIVREWRREKRERDEWNKSVTRG